MAIRSLKTGSFSRSTQVGNSIILPGDYESIATLTANGTFTNIPQTYKHLQIRFTTRDTAATAQQYFYIRLNGTTSTYREHYLLGDGASATAGTRTGSYLNQVYIPGGNATANVFGVGVIDILDYTDTNKNKTIRSLGGYDNNGSGNASFYSGLWVNTAAVTSIECGTDNGAAASGTRIALYGIRG